MDKRKTISNKKDGKQYILETFQIVCSCSEAMPKTIDEISNKYLSD